MGDELLQLLKDNQISDIQKTVTLGYFYKQIISGAIKYPDQIEAFHKLKFKGLGGKKEIIITILEYINYAYFKRESINLQP